ncbi:MAG: hypothetical protein II814_12825, partial [Treponema sp.]|nr:hypothetical protein [Treponema sp.]
MLALFAAGCNNSSSAPYIPSSGGSTGKVVDLSTLTADTVIGNNTTLSGTLANSVKISIAAGATVTLKNVSINADGSLASADHAGIVCEGDATIVLADGSTNDVKGFMDGPSGIHVLPGFTLTINGSTGVLNASTQGGGAGIGSGFLDNAGKRNAGNIVINGGVINATGGLYGAGIGAGGRSVVGDITINGGTITATAGANAAGIGCGQTTSKGTSKCGNIVIANTVTKVTATKGDGSTHCIGRGQEKDGKSAVCGTVTIGGAEGYISESPYTYPPEPPAGGINGLFSVSATKKVYFSKGNLRATTNDNGSSWTWSFAVSQGDAVGMAAANTTINGNGTVSVNGSVDLFGWVGANSAFTGMAAFGISNSTTEGDYRTAEGAALNDWGTNAISNGGNVANYGWRTLTQVEWNYVLNTRAGADSKKGAATVNSVAGWILLPDDWTLPAGASFTAGCANGYTTNTYTAER